MRVLIVNDLGTDTGGAERVSLSLRERLRTDGHEVMLFSSSFQPVADVPVDADVMCRGASGRSQSVLSVVNLSAMRGLGKLLESYQPDVVHLRMFQWQLSPLVLRCLGNWPCLVHVVNYDLICPVNTKTLPSGQPCAQQAGRVCLSEGCLGLPGYARFLAQGAIRSRYFERARDRLITNSYWVRGRLSAEGVRVDDVVWNGVAITPERTKLCPGSPTIGYAGRLVPKKGVDTLVRAVAIAQEQVPDLALLIAGEGESRQELQELAETLGIEDSVKFLGHLSKADMDREFERLWVQAAPSLWEEPFGLVAAEGMMRSTAVITTNTGGLSEQNIVDKTGYTVSPGDVDQWADAIVRIVSDRDRAVMFGRNAREHAERNLSFDAFYEHILAQYELTIQAKAARTDG
ncbi:MAG: glycosyltransferase family 1 protein [Phycisphaera sp.]|nr:MAG: glycosyltransferase family 1 protein [Phycisphaera sp.]